MASQHYPINDSINDTPLLDAITRSMPQPAPLTMRRRLRIRWVNWEPRIRITHAASVLRHGIPDRDWD